MPFLQLDTGGTNLDVEVQTTGAGGLAPAVIGKTYRAHSNKLLSTVRGIVRSWQFTSGPLTQAEYETLDALVADGVFLDCSGDALDPAGGTVTCLVTIEEGPYLDAGGVGFFRTARLRLDETLAAGAAVPAPPGGEASPLAVLQGDNAMCGYADTAAFHATAAYPNYGFLYDGSDALQITTTPADTYAGCPGLDVIHGTGKTGGFYTYIDPTLGEDVWFWRRFVISAGYDNAETGAFTGLVLGWFTSQGLSVPGEGTIRHDIFMAIRSSRIKVDVVEKWNGPGPFIEDLHTETQDAGLSTLLVGAGVREMIAFTNRVDASTRRFRLWIGAPGNTAALPKLLDFTYPSVVARDWEAVDQFNYFYPLPSPDALFRVYGWGLHNAANPWGVTL